MFEWFFAPYSSLLVGVEFLLRNPAACSAVELLRGLTLLLCATAGARVGAHCVADRRLRRRSRVYGPDEFSGLYDLYCEAGTRVGLKRLPPLYRQVDEDPLAFTTGSFRPAVFLAPALIRSLRADELRAVLVHELVHVRRRDNLRAWLASLLPIGALVVLLQAATLYVLFFQVELRFGFAHAGLLVAAVLALLWTFRSVAWPRVVFRRELSCDDRVVEALQNPLVVAASLVQVWRLQRALPRRRGARWIHAHAFLRTRPGVEARVRRLIDFRPDPRRAWLNAGGRALAAAALLWTFLFLWTYHGPDLRVQLPDVVPEISLTQSYQQAAPAEVFFAPSFTTECSIHPCDRTLMKAYITRATASQLLVLLFLFTAPAAAQGQDALVVPRLTGTVDLDGASGEAAWDAVPALTMTTYEPVFGAPPSERTEVRIAHDGTHLYVAGRFYDSRPAQVRAQSLTRDRVEGDDQFLLVVDGFDDNESALTFVVTPRGHAAGRDDLRGCPGTGLAQS